MADNLDEHGFPKPQDDFGANPFASPIAAAAPTHGYVNRPDETLNPWLSVWLNPRATVRQIVEIDPTYHVILLAVLGGMATSFDEERALEVGGDLPNRVGFFIGMLIGGAIGGLIGLFLIGWLVSVTGRWLGGVATAQYVRTALGWANVPGICLLPFTIILTLMWVANGNEMLDMENSVPIALMWFAYYIAMLILGLWQFVIACRMVGEVHEFSGWRGLGSMLLAGLLVFVVIGLPLILILVLLFST